jgi:hypothetical protein
MENLHHQMIERIKTLIHREVELAQQLRTIELEKRENQSEFNAAKTYIFTSRDPAIKREFRKIIDFKKELMSPDKRTQKVVQSKSHLVIRILQEHGREGLEADEVIALLPSDVEIDRNYLITILGKLRKRGMAIKDGNKFFITEPGHPHIAAVPAS